MTYHVPMCLYCAENEVAAPFTYENGDGFCSVECNNRAHEEMDTFDGEEPVAGWTDSDIAELDRDAEYDAFLSQYDNDPSPYDGTYSEE